MIIRLAIMSRTRWSPSALSPRVLQCGGAGYTGTAPPGRSLLNRSPTSTSRAAPGSVICSWSDSSLGPWQVCMSQNRPVSVKLPVLTTMPVVPPSPATPPKPLSNLLISSMSRTPRSL